MVPKSASKTQNWGKQKATKEKNGKSYLNTLINVIKVLHRCLQVKGEKKIWVPANYHAGKVKQTHLCRRSSVPPQQQKNYIVESGPNAKEIEIGTTAESLELRFRLYLFFYLFKPWIRKLAIISGNASVVVRLLPFWNYKGQSISL